MSEISVIQKRKTQIENFFSNTSIQQKLVAYFNSDETKIERFRATMSMICMDRDFQKWNPASVLACGIIAAQIGLSPQPSLGQIYFVAYKNELQVAIGYKGWLALLERADKACKAYPIYKCDEFLHEINGFDDAVVFKPNYDQHRDDDVKWIDENLRGVFVMIKDLRTQVINHRFVPKTKLDQLRNASPSVQRNKFSPWTNYAAEMFMAKGIKYVLSKTAMDDKTAMAVKIEDDFEIKHARVLEKRGSYVAQEIESDSVAADVETPPADDFNQEQHVFDQLPQNEEIGEPHEQKLG